MSEIPRQAIKLGKKNFLTSKKIVFYIIIYTIESYIYIIEYYQIKYAYRLIYIYTQLLYDLAIAKDLELQPFICEIMNTNRNSDHDSFWVLKGTQGRPAFHVCY